MPTISKTMEKPIIEFQNVTKEFSMNSQKTFKEFTFRVVKTPVGKEIGVKTHRIGSQTIFITDTERTLLDCLHKPKYAEGWENVFHALTKIKRIDDEKIFDYAKVDKYPDKGSNAGNTKISFER